MATMPREGGILPGPADHRYVKVPALLLLALAPVLGGLFVVFLPFIGFGLVFWLAGKKAVMVARRTAEELAATRAWQPGEAYFTDERERREVAKAEPGGETVEGGAEKGATPR
jgi:hypothetical protein